MDLTQQQHAYKIARESLKISNSIVFPVDFSIPAKKDCFCILLLLLPGKRSLTLFCTLMVAVIKTFLLTVYGYTSKKIEVTQCLIVGSGAIFYGIIFSLHLALDIVVVCARVIRRAAVSLSELMSADIRSPDVVTVPCFPTNPEIHKLGQGKQVSVN